MTWKRVLFGGSIKLNGLCGTEGMEKNMETTKFCGIRSRGAATGAALLHILLTTSKLVELLALRSAVRMRRRNQF